MSTDTTLGSVNPWDAAGEPFIPVSRTRQPAGAKSDADAHLNARLASFGILL